MHMKPLQCYVLKLSLTLKAPVMAQPQGAVLLFHVHEQTL